MAVVTAPEVKGIPTIFGEPFEKSITFCVDTSGSMFKGLDIVKEHLIETLLKHSKKNCPTFFNIIEFNSEITQWADKMVKCSQETVEVASQWINRLSAKTGTNTQDALLIALEDSACGAVYLVTDGLPDQHPEDILDQVSNASCGRPIHCIYLCTEDALDTAAVEFLEDLSVESYGSFHIVTITQHGCVERVTPIYRADHAQERIIRTLNGTMHSSMKSCSVATRLKVDPEESLSLTPRVSLLNTGPYGYFGHPGYHPLYGYWFMHPYRYYFPHGWSRYRPARGWLKAQETMFDHIESSEVSPAAGALLIGKKVLARRIDDGYFYIGTVKSQILSDKFLVAFGPCKHGKYKEVVYQDTFVYDLVDYDDALRHAIVTSDKVLAPWEPEGERFGPGFVIEGHEKRTSAGPEDQPITVTLSNGKTVQVPADRAVWVPQEVYERLVLELKMPKEARETLQNQPNYPMENLPGYPTSGPEAEPAEFVQPHPIQFDTDPLFYESRPWQYPYVSSYPVQLKRRENIQAKSSVRSEEMNKLVPGTNYTQSQLDDKITSQLMEHKLILDEKDTEKAKTEETHTEKQDFEKQVEQEKQKQEDNSYNENSHAAREEYFKQLEREHKEIEEEEARISQERIRQLEKEIEKERQREREKLLKKRQKQEENLLKKSVRFADDNEFEDLERTALRENDRLESSQEGELVDSSRELHRSWDSGLDTLNSTQESQKNRPEEEFRFHFAGEDDYVNYLTRCQGKDDHNRSYSRLSHDNRCRSNSPKRPSSAQLPRRSVKRSTKRPPWVKYWGSDSVPDMIDPPSHGKFRETALQTPLEARDQRQYPYIVEWTSPAFKYVDPQARHNYTSSVGQLMKTPKAPCYEYIPHQPQVTRTLTAEAKEEARREFRRTKVQQRQMNWNTRLHQQDMMKELMQDQHKERIIAQMEREKQRQLKEEELIRKSREAKKQISAELRSKVEEAQRVEKEKQEKRIEAMRVRREQRDAKQIQAALEMEAVNEQRKQARSQKSQARWDEHQKRLDEEVKQNEQRAGQVLNAKVNRIEHFRKLEEEGQRKKDLRLAVSEQHLDLYRSQVLP